MRWVSHFTHPSRIAMLLLLYAGGAWLRREVPGRGDIQRDRQVPAAGICAESRQLRARDEGAPSEPAVAGTCEGSTPCRLAKQQGEEGQHCAWVACTCSVQVRVADMQSACLLFATLSLPRTRSSTASRRLRKLAEFAA